MMTRLVMLWLNSYSPSLNKTNQLSVECSDCKLHFFLSQLLLYCHPNLNFFDSSYFSSKTWISHLSFLLFFSWLLWGEGHIKTLWSCSCLLKQVLWSVLSSTHFFISCQPTGVWEENWKAEEPVPILNKANCEGTTNSIISSTDLQFLKEMVS